MDIKKEGKNKSPLQTSEQQLAIKIINALNEWMRIGAIENYGVSNAFIEQHFREIVSRKYHPNKYLEFRKSICNELWMDSIFLKLKAEGKDGLAEEILQRRDKLIKEAIGIDKNLEPNNALHLPNLQLIYLASRFRNAIQQALSCLETKSTNSNYAGEKNKPQGNGGDGSALDSRTEQILDVYRDAYTKALKRELKKRKAEIESQKQSEPKTHRKDKHVESTLEGEWSNPMTKSAMMSKVNIDGYKKFNTFAKTYGLRQAGNRQLWQIRLDKMDINTKRKFEKA